MEYAVKAYAKLNLALDSVGRYPDGYHELSMLMQSVSFSDTLYIHAIPEGFELTSTDVNLITDDRNTVTKVYRALAARYPLPSGVAIHIEKHIWSEAGLGGGSADAAAALVGMNRLFGLGLNADELRELGISAGMDTAFCIEGGTAHATGRGEKIENLEYPGKLYFVLVRPNFGISTKLAYKSLAQKLALRHPNIAKLKQLLCLLPGELCSFTSEMGNVLEEAVSDRYPLIQTIKQRLRETGAVGAMMTGSGSCVFGVYGDAAAAEAAASQLRGEYADVVYACAVDRGNEFVTAV